MEEYSVTSEDLDKFMTAALRKVSMQSTAADCSTCERAYSYVRKAEDLIRVNFRKAKLLDDKSPDVSDGHSSHILTETDKAVEELLVQGLRGEFVDHKFIAEEAIGSLNSQLPEFSNNPTWIIDPIDGTMNFVHGNPLTCISVGLAVNRKLVLGIVSAPMIGHTYTAIKGRGAFLNGEECLRASGVKKLSDAMILMELSAGANSRKKQIGIENVTTLMNKAHAIRCPGPAALDMAWIGAGSADAFFHFGIHCWDMAAGALLITEAGGCVLNSDGSEFNLMGRNLVAASTVELAREVVDAIRRYPVEPEFGEHCPV